MLAVHALWSSSEAVLVLWAEDGELPPAAPPRRGRRPARPKPERHPFAAPVVRLAEACGELGSFSGVSAQSPGARAEATVWLPGHPTAPDPSPQLVREDASAPRPAGSREPGVWPFVVPALRLAPGAGLDLLLSLAGPDVERPGIRVGASVRALGLVGELALEAVAGGRVLPDLRVGDDGRHEARWSPLGGGADAERARLLAATLPPVCRSLVAEGADPAAVVEGALGAFVDAACREGLRTPLVRAPRSGATGGTHAAGAWLTALGAASPVVDAEPGELAALERLVAEWRSGAAGRGGPWRLCLRLREPPPQPSLFDGPHGHGPLGDEDDAVVSAAADEAAESWRVELLLQATDDPSLLVDAEEVWRAPDELRWATRTLAAPHEVLLAELGRAVRAYPDLAPALRLPAPTGLETDLAGAHQFLSEAAPALEVAGFGVLLPSWWRQPMAQLGLRLRVGTEASNPGGSGSGLLTAEGLATFDWQAAIAGQDVGLEELKRLAELKQPLVRVRGQWAELRAEEVAALVEFLTEGRERSRTATVAEALRLAAGAPGAAPLEGVPVVEIEAGGTIGAMLSGELEDALEIRGTPAGFCGELRPYQARGVAWIELLERLGLGACLADDMGLGKTATVLALVQSERRPATSCGDAKRRTRGTGSAGTPASRGCEDAGARGPTLVVCPTSVVGNWQREAGRFTPELRVVVHHGATRARGKELRRQAESADVVVTSYPIVERDRVALGSVEWGRIVLDEAQHVKNPAAKQTKAVRALRAPRRLALTGTPVENHLGELWSIMEILNPGLLGPERTFRERFAVPIERYREEEPAERLRVLTRPFLLRRLKTDRSIISDLPEKLEMKVVCTLTKEQATLYQAVVDEMLGRIDDAEGIERKGLILTTMLRLKQVCNHPAQFLGDGSALPGRSGKLERTVEVLEEVLAVSEKALVFTQFAEMGQMLQGHLQGRLGRRVSFLHGGVPRARRDEMVTAFQSGDGDGDVPIMVLSLKAGGTGLNLTAANHVVHFDRWWNPAVENQATDRAFRIGQRRDVQVRKLVCAGTVEDRIDTLIESKRELAARIVGAGEGWLTELSTEDLAEVFRLSAETVGAQ